MKSAFTSFFTSSSMTFCFFGAKLLFLSKKEIKKVRTKFVDDNIRRYASYVGNYLSKDISISSKECNQSFFDFRCQKGSDVYSFIWIILQNNAHQLFGRLSSAGSVFFDI